MEQCEARAHRMGQSSMVDVHYIFVEGSIDDQAFHCLCSKTQATSAILDGEVKAFSSEKVSAAIQQQVVSEEEHLRNLVALHTAKQEEKDAKRAMVHAEREAKRRKRSDDIAAQKASKAEERATKKAAQSQVKHLEL